MNPAPLIVSAALPVTEEEIAADAVRLAREVGREIASPAEARELLGLAPYRGGTQLA